MGLKITSSLTFADGGTSTTSYIHISFYNKPKEKDVLYAGINLYTSKSKREESLSFASRTVGGDNSISSGENITLSCTMDEYVADNGAAIAYPKLKAYLEGLGHTVVDDI